MEKVSKKVPNGIESAYFSLDYRPSPDYKNFDLNNACSSFMTYLAIADITRRKEDIDFLSSKFADLLLLCKTVEEVQRLSNLMIMTKKVGGYAVEFYELIPGILEDVKNIKKGKNVDKVQQTQQENLIKENQPSLGSNEKNVAPNEVDNFERQTAQKDEKTTLLKETKNVEPVSFRENDGVRSEYFDIQYRPSEDKKNYNLNIDCSSFLMAMALADITRKPNQIDDVFIDFCKIMESCRTEEERKNVIKFLEEIKNKGGYGVEFYASFSDDLSFSGIEKGVSSYLSSRIQPVSQMQGPNIVSKYYSESKRVPNENNSNLNELYKSFLDAMVLADIERSEESISKVVEVFNEMVLACETKGDFLGCRRCILGLSNIGGYAFQFSKNYSSMLNQEGKNKLLEEKELADEQEKMSNFNYSEWNEEMETAYKRLLFFFENNNNLDADELLVIINKYRYLMSNLDVLRKKVTPQKIVDIQHTLQEYIKKMYRLFEWNEEYLKLKRMYDELESLRILDVDELNYLTTKFNNLSDELGYIGFNSSFSLIKSLNFQVEEYLEDLQRKKRMVDNISGSLSF